MSLDFDVHGATFDPERHCPWHDPERLVLHEWRPFAAAAGGARGGMAMCIHCRQVRGMRAP